MTSRLSMNRMADKRAVLRGGDPAALGSRWDGEGVLFSAYSASAEMLELCLFDDQGIETQRYEFGDCADGVWHGYLPGIGPGTQYGLRAHGRFVPEAGHFFNPQRLLIDPYARELSGVYQHSPHNAVCEPSAGEGAEGARRSSTFSNDNAAFVPRCVVVEDSPTKAQALNRTRSDRVIYEAHVRGLSALNAALPSELQGRFEGAGSTEIINHLRALGITSLQLLPLHKFIDEPHLQSKSLTNYWGYNTLSFFALNDSYAALSGAVRDEFRRLVRALHDANIEVFVDVVFNHTAEGGIDGPTLCYRGLDNATYYRMDAANNHAYINDTGCGNTVNTDSPMVRRLILDSLRYLGDEFGVDGFRFDLAVTLGRTAEGFDPEHPLLLDIQNDTLLGERVLIAEPWDVGPGGYQTGGFNRPWHEWNDRFRDAARAFWRNDRGAQAELGKRLHGSSDLFEASGRDSSSSVNFITAHDGFTLADLVAYAQKHNEANGEHNRDGHDHNLSDNCGVEGATDDPTVVSLRARRSRALLATLMLAQGTPMLLAGDELGNSQSGNNNSYCQDNATSWLSWPQRAHTHVDFVSRLTDLRRHLLVYQHRSHVHAPWLGGRPEPGDCALSWRQFDGSLMHDNHWLPEVAEGALPFVLIWALHSELLLLAFNPSADCLSLTLPDSPYEHSSEFVCLLDSSEASGRPDVQLQPSATNPHPEVGPQSITVFRVAASGNNSLVNPV